MKLEYLNKLEYNKILEKYIGQLEEIYNILRKIEGVEARLNNLEDYSDLAHGRDKAKYLQEEIDMTEELVGLNKDLLAAQKYMENTEQQAILNSPVGDVFSRHVGIRTVSERGSR